MEGNFREFVVFCPSFRLRRGFSSFPSLYLTISLRSSPFYSSVGFSWISTVGNDSFNRFQRDPRSFLLSESLSLSVKAVAILLKMLTIDPLRRATLNDIKEMVLEAGTWSRERCEEEDLREGSVFDSREKAPSYESEATE